MIALVLDTNILCKESFYSRNMELLMRLSSIGHVQVYIPEVVKREYLTRRINESIEETKKVQKSLSTIAEDLNRKLTLYSGVINVQKTCQEIEACLEGEINKEFDAWVSSNKINVIPLDTSCLSVVLDEYFFGMGLFSEAKDRERSRRHFPDAIINFSIMQLKRENNVLTVILNDGPFRKHLKIIEGIKVLDSIKEFLGEKDNAKKIQELDSSSEKIESIKEYLSSDDFANNLRINILASRSNIETTELGDDQIVNIKKLDKIPINSPIVNSIQVGSINNLKTRDVVFIDKGYFSLVLCFVATATIDYHVSDYLHSSNYTEKEGYLNSSTGEKFCKISESRDLSFHGDIQLYFDGDLSASDIKSYSCSLGAKDNPLQFQIIMQQANILERSNSLDGK